MSTDQIHADLELDQLRDANAELRRANIELREDNARLRRDALPPGYPRTTTTETEPPATAIGGLSSLSRLSDTIRTAATGNLFSHPTTADAFMLGLTVAAFPDMVVSGGYPTHRAAAMKVVTWLDGLLQTIREQDAEAAESMVATGEASGGS